MTNSFVGKVVSSVQGAEEYSESICFTTECGEVWEMYHDQSCCERVYVAEITWGRIK